MEENILIIESPLQLLNANEAIDQFLLENVTIFIRYAGVERSDKQISELISILEIEKKSKIYEISINAFKKGITDYLKILYFQMFFYIKRKYFKKIFIGNISSGFISRFMNYFPKENIILMDDGSQTISLQKKFNKDHFYHLFTMYDREKIDGQKIYTNTFTNLKSRLNSERGNEKGIVLFIGAKLSEVSLITEDYYMTLINRVSEKYKDLEILYIPHRGESESKLKRIENIRNIKIKSLDFPIELFALYEKKEPKIIASFYSTALLTMRKLYDENVDVVSFYFDFQHSEHKRTIGPVYEFYKNYMEIVDIS